MTLALSLFFCWFSLWMLHKFSPQPNLKTKYLVLLLVIPFVIYPFVYSPVWWLRGLTGDLSIASLVLLFVSIYQQLYAKALISHQERRLLWRSLALLGLVFYPLALGVGQLDPYVWGYANPYMFGVLLALSLLAFLRQYYVIGIILLAVVLAWNMQVLESVNLWDYLIDPFIFFYFLGKVIRCRS